MKLATVAALMSLALSIAILPNPATAAETSRAPSPKKRSAMIYKPNIQYPLAAKQAGITGAGVVVVSVNSAGEVTNVVMGRSTGHDILDQASIEAFRTARFLPGTVPLVKIPIRFTLAGGGQFYEYVDVKSKNMDDVLAAFLGKGTVKKGPIPAYPRYPEWTTKSGKGVYELHADKDGKVFQVKILKTSGDAVFDREAVKTLGKWRLARGPLIIELPLRFELAPTNYSVDVGR